MQCTDTSEAGLAAIITRAEREIELIQEYRTCLVSGVVTGKIDVRFVIIPEAEQATPDQESKSDEKPEDKLTSLETAA